MTQFNFEAMCHRLEEALQKNGRAATEVSVASGLSPSYLHNVLRRGQMPTVEKLVKICAELGVSILWIIHGLNVPDRAEEVFEVMERDPKRFWAMMQLV